MLDPTVRRMLKSRAQEHEIGNLVDVEQAVRIGAGRFRLRMFVTYAVAALGVGLLTIGTLAAHFATAAPIGESPSTVTETATVTSTATETATETATATTTLRETTTVIVTTTVATTVTSTTTSTTTIYVRSPNPPPAPVAPPTGSPPVS